MFAVVLVMASLAAGHKLVQLDSSASRMYSSEDAPNLDKEENHGIILTEKANAASDQALFICNAYAHSAPLDVVDLPAQRALTAGNPIPYKSCRNFNFPLREGDRLEFKAGHLSVGVFQAVNIPKKRSSLLLVPHRRHVDSLTAAFVSHAFVDDAKPQVVVIDAFRGKEMASLKIVDAAASEGAKQRGGTLLQQQREEDLLFNAAVSLSPGKYQIELRNPNQQTLSKSQLQVAPGAGKYVVLRVGNEGTKGDAAAAGDKAVAVAFPQELLVVKSGATILTIPRLLAVLVCAFTSAML
mmetsp:Transcript_15863/g.30748  ORF Transcript_15863/g.30748 Transcript_15863/m.30748 type:complete len:297 (+) Transcript_15863:82-972(+)